MSSTPPDPESGQVNGGQSMNGVDLENPMSPTSVKPDNTDKIFQPRLTFEPQKKLPLPPYLKVLKQISAFVILAIVGIIVIGSIADYTKYDVSTTMDIRRIPPPYHITLCFDVPEIVITSKLPLELQTKLSALKSKSRSDFIALANDEISKELTVTQLNDVTPSLIQLLSSVKLGEESIPVDSKNIVTFFKGLTKCFTIKFDHLNWFKFFESKLVIRFHDKSVKGVNVFIHYDNLIHGNRRSYKLIQFGSIGSNGASGKVTLSYRIVRRLFLPPPYVTNCWNYVNYGDDSKAAAVDTCLMRMSAQAGHPIPDHLIQPINSTLKYTTVKGRAYDGSGQGSSDNQGSGQSDSEQGNKEKDALTTFLTNSSRECLSTFHNPDCIEDTITIQEIDRELVTPDVTDYEPELIITNPIDDFTLIHYVPLKTFGDEIFACAGAIGFLIATFLLVSYLSKVVLRLCNKHSHQQY